MDNHVALALGGDDWYGGSDRVNVSAGLGIFVEETVLKVSSANTGVPDKAMAMQAYILDIILGDNLAQVITKTIFQRSAFLIIDIRSS